MSKSKSIVTLRGSAKREKKGFLLKYPIVLRGREFSRFDIKAIGKCVQKYFSFGRTRISMEVCQELDWKQPNGWPKDRACRDVLRKVQEFGLIKLPPCVKSPRRSNQVTPKLRTRFVYKQIAFSGEITLEFAKGNKAESTWNELVKKQHYLGHKVVVGRCLKYLIKHRGILVGAISFSSAAWQVESRDKALSDLGVPGDGTRDCVLNNSRFLVLNTLNVPNLASRILSIAVKQVAHDWAEFYSVTPRIIETFVQPSKFKGTCYKAANWVEVGRTKGFAKHGMQHVNSQESKIIFLYGLSPEMRKGLLKIHSQRTQLEQRPR